MRTGEAFVQLSWGDEGGQMSPDELRQHALACLSVAEAAEQDALAVKMFADTPQQAGQVLQLMRQTRGATAGSGRASITPITPEDFPASWPEDA